MYHGASYVDMQAKAASGWLANSWKLRGAYRLVKTTLTAQKAARASQPTCSEASQHLPDAVASLAIVTQHVDSKFEVQDVPANSHIIMSYSLASWKCHDRRRGVSGSPRMAPTSSALQTASGRTWLKCPSRQIYPSAPMNFSCSSGPPTCNLGPRTHPRLGLIVAPVA